MNIWCPTAVAMPDRRIISLWFPHLGAERAMRCDPQLDGHPLAIVAEAGNTLTLAGLNREGMALGLRLGMGLRDAHAICPKLLTRPSEPRRDAAFLTALQRWAGQFTPWVATDTPNALLLDITGCAHLCGGEAGMVLRIRHELVGFGLTARLGVAETVGAAWALARFSGAQKIQAYAGDAIEQETRATRSRARKRRWERGGEPPVGVHDLPSGEMDAIVPPGAIMDHVGALPVAALRLGTETVSALHSLGLRRIADVAVLPRAHLAQRLGSEIIRQLDLMFGRIEEPITPTLPEPVMALRLTLPEPIGLEKDVLGAIDRLLGPLCDRLKAAGLGVRQIRVTLIRVEGTCEIRSAGFARPTDEAEAIRPILVLRLGDIDAGFGIEAVRLEACTTEQLNRSTHRGQLAVRSETTGRHNSETSEEAIADLIGRIGAKLGLEAVTRLHPADSHIPEKSATVMAAGFSHPADSWPEPSAPRPIILFPPEAITPKTAGIPPRSFRWRRQMHQCAHAAGPERISPEWWLDDPAWRSGARDYWRIETIEGLRLWIFEAKGGAAPPGWFIQGRFA